MAGAPQEEPWQPDGGLAKRVHDAVQQWQQGDVIVPGFSAHVADPERPLTPESAQLGGTGLHDVFTQYEAMAVVTQTCDVVRGVTVATGGRPLVQVSPVVRLTGQRLIDAQRGRVPRYAAVPGYAEDALVDLDMCTTVEKTVLAGSKRVPGCPDDDSLMAFGLAVARHRARFAFPNHMDRAMAKLRQRMTDRADKNSPAGRRVEEVLEIRATATPSWGADSIAVELVFLVDDAALPAVDLDDEVSERIRDFLSQDRTEAEVAAALERDGVTDADRSVLWMALAEIWTRLVRTDGALTAVSGVAESEASYTRARQNRSVRLDLDHLSSQRASHPWAG